MVRKAEALNGGSVSFHYQRQINPDKPVRRMLVEALADICRENMTIGQSRIGGLFTGDEIAGRLTVCTNNYTGPRFSRTVNKDATAIPDRGVKEIADVTKHDRQCVHIVVGDVKIAPCNKGL